MSIMLPKLIAIDHDDYHAEFVGNAADGRQFFLTTLFVPASPTIPGNEFVALYLFDKRGNLIEALIRIHSYRSFRSRTTSTEQ